MIENQDGASVRPHGASTKPMVEAQDIWKSYGDVDVLRGVELDVAAGEVLCIMGPSGGGKSTFLRCINALEDIDAGRIFVDGELIGFEELEDGRLRRLRSNDLVKQQRQMGMVFQQFNLFPHMTALENAILAPVKVKGMHRDEAIEQARELFSQFGLGEKFDNYPRQLSGGQQQRSAIVRSLMMEPKLMLFDEPTSALDPELVGDVLSALRDLAQRGLTMIVVTHEVGFARESSDRVVLLDSGRKLEEGPPEQVLVNPVQERSKAFLARVTAEQG